MIGSGAGAYLGEIAAYVKDVRAGEFHGSHLPVGSEPGGNGPGSRCRVEKGQVLGRYGGDVAVTAADVVKVARHQDAAAAPGSERVHLDIWITDTGEYAVITRHDPTIGCFPIAGGHVVPDQAVGKPDAAARIACRVKKAAHVEDVSLHQQRVDIVLVVAIAQAFQPLVTRRPIPYGGPGFGRGVPHGDVVGVCASRRGEIAADVDVVPVKGDGIDVRPVSIHTTNVLRGADGHATPVEAIIARIVEMNPVVRHRCDAGKATRQLLPLHAVPAGQIVKLPANVDIAVYDLDGVDAVAKATPGCPQRPQIAVRVRGEGTAGTKVAGSVGESGPGVAVRVVGVHLWASPARYEVKLPISGDEAAAIAGGCASVRRHGCPIGLERRVGRAVHPDVLVAAYQRAAGEAGGADPIHVHGVVLDGVDQQPLQGDLVLRRLVSADPGVPQPDAALRVAQCEVGERHADGVGDVYRVEAAAPVHKDRVGVDAADGQVVLAFDGERDVSARLDDDLVAGIGGGHGGLDSGVTAGAAVVVYVAGGEDGVGSM